MSQIGRFEVTMSVSVERGVGAYDNWSYLGITSPRKVYLGSTIRGLGYNLKSEQGQVCLPVHPDYSQPHMGKQG